MRRRKNPFFSREPRVELDIKYAQASRAVYLDSTPPKIAVAMRTADNQLIEFELDTEVARELIEQMSTAYFAIYPALKVARQLPWG